MTEKSRSNEHKNKLTLYQIEEQKARLLDQLVESGGELNDYLETALAEIDCKEVAKIDGYAHVMEKLKHEAEYWKKKAKEYDAVAKGCIRFADRMKDRIKGVMEHTDQTELSGNDVKFKLSEMKPKLEIDIANLDMTYTMQVVTREVDKEMIRKDLEQGFKIRGAKLVPVKALRQYANKK